MAIIYTLYPVELNYLQHSMASVMSFVMTVMLILIRFGNLNNVYNRISTLQAMKWSFCDLTSKNEKHVLIFLSTYQHVKRTFDQKILKPSI